MRFQHGLQKVGKKSGYLLEFLFARKSPAVHLQCCRLNLVYDCLTANFPALCCVDTWKEVRVKKKSGGVTLNKRRELKLEVLCREYKNFIETGRKIILKVIFISTIYKGDIVRDQRIGICSRQGRE